MSLLSIFAALAIAAGGDGALRRRMSYSVSAAARTKSEFAWHWALKRRECTEVGASRQGMRLAVSRYLGWPRWLCLGRKRGSMSGMLLPA